MLNVVVVVVIADLTSRPGFWGKALPERYVEVGVVFCFYFTASGDMMLNVDGHDKGVFLTGIDSRTPLWVMVDIYGNTTGVQFMGKRHQRLLLSPPPFSCLCRHLLVSLRVHRGIGLDWMGFDGIWLLVLDG